MQIHNFTRIGDVLLVVARGPGKLTYAILNPPTQTTMATTQTSFPTSLPTQTAASQTSPVREAAASFPLYYLASLLAGVAAALYFWRRRRPSGGLSEVDMLIFRHVKERGGAFESDIAKSLEIPRTTVLEP